MPSPERPTRHVSRRPPPRRRSARRRSPAGLIVLIVGLVVLGGAATGMLLAGGGDDPVGVTATQTLDGGPVATTNRPVSHGGDAVMANASTPGASSPAADPRSPADWPLSGAAAKAKHVPILMYHLIAAAPAGTAYPGLWVPPAELEAQVAALGEAGFTGVTLDELWDAWHGDGRLPKRPVVLSFDDGSLSQVLAAAPILQAAGWPGVLNLTLDHLRKDGMPTWGAKRLLAQGWSIDSHTVSHPDVTTLDAAGFASEIADSRKLLTEKLGVPARFFCYPAGKNDPASRAAVKAAGYEAATTTQPGLASADGDPFTLPRIRVDPGTSGDRLVALAKGEATNADGGGE